MTSIADGMNLVAKEFAAVHSAEHPGVLVMSDGCGAIDELTAAVVVDRRSVAAIADGIERAVDMSIGERAGRSTALRDAVDARSSHDWARTVVLRIVESHRHDSDDVDAHDPSPPSVPRRAPVTPISLPNELEQSIELWNRRMRGSNVIERLWRRDPSLWPGNAEAIAGRLGWLEADHWLADHVAVLRAFALDIEHAGYTTAVVLGMGGSSAAARVFARLGEEAPRGLRLLVLDSTVPAAVRAVEREIDPGRTLFVVVSKSGETIETHAFMDYFWARHQHGEDFVAITDPGTPLHEVALDRGFREVFLNPSDIGGRFSALSYPGLLPAALAGLDLDLLATHARAMERACRATELDANPGARLAAVLAHTALDRGVVFIETDRRLRGLDDWRAQLIAESTGKSGRGLLPVRPAAGTGTYAAGDTVFVVGDVPETRVATLEARGSTVIRVSFADRHAIAAEMMRWQIGVALACSLIDVNAFDEPDVALAKRATTGALASDTIRSGVIEARPNLDVGDGHRFIAIHAYVERTPWNEAVLGALQRRIGKRYGLPVAIEFGPALLHATGQYYKGGADDGLVIQVVDAGEADLPIPGRPYGFGTLLQAQAHGDATAMREMGRQVMTSTITALRLLAVGPTHRRTPAGARG